MVLLSSIMSFVLIFLIRFYQFFISPFMESNCRFYPTCSVYAVIALYNHSLYRALIFITIRL
ncbi:MAG: membrane protein insertion efficiency factor YidD, partial [Buchnera aphidicola]|nr:membrane protein insertion efficiency factor YidD [Buchnera aphidicola]